MNNELEITGKITVYEIKYNYNLGNEYDCLYLTIKNKNEFEFSLGDPPGDICINFKKDLNCWKVNRIQNNVNSSKLNIEKIIDKLKKFIENLDLENLNLSYEVI